MTKVATKTKKKRPTDLATAPLIAGAFFCERVLVEDQVMSAIRIVDTFNIDKLPDEQFDVPVSDRKMTKIDAAFITMIRSGGYAGSCDILILCRTPSGESGPVGLGKGKLEGGAHGLNLRLPVLFPYDGPGVYYYDVQVNERLMTSAPFILNVEERNVKGR